MMPDTATPVEIALEVLDRTPRVTMTPLNFVLGPTAEAAPAIYRITKEIHFCYGHRLLNYNGKCRNLHGHNGKAVITLEMPGLDSLGMVVDFSDVKRVIGKWIDDNLDHRMLLHKDDPILPELRRQGEPVVTMDVNPTAENIARLIYFQGVNHGLPVVEVTLWEAENSFATFRPMEE
ncbi:MAG: 6-pyruvoyl trahydropterin synthase family protein [Fimbriiglobus sp.]